MFAAADVSAARLFYERAATGGSAAGATGVGKTYDPAFLSRLNAFGIRSDPSAAATWYRKAVTLGDPEAERLLRRLGAAVAD
jgi:TPR repeat protein